MNSNQPCKDNSCGCSPVSRRNFIQLLGAGVAVAASSTGAMAGPFERKDFDSLVPTDKRLTPEWIKSLYERGTPTWLSGKELEFLGMPIGGICAGQVYLGGDGKLWHWDIFNQHLATGDGNYAHPPKPGAPMVQGFALRATIARKGSVHTLDKAGFSDIQFRGEYPIGLVKYRDASLPIEVSLEAFSPFIPLNPQDSSLPATVMRYTLKNTGGEVAEIEIGGWVKNPICLFTGNTLQGVRTNSVAREPGLLMVECSAGNPKEAANARPPRPQIVFEDFEKETYEGWTVEGTAFGEGPIEKSKMPAYQGDVGGVGKRVVNSHNVRHGGDVVAGDNATGKLTSKEFTIERDFITFYIGGGNNPGLTCLNLVVDGKVARTATGMNDNRMREEMFDVTDLAGKTGRIEIVDAKAGGWGNIGADQIVFTDTPLSQDALTKQHDYGTFTLALLDAADNDAASAALSGEDFATLTTKLSSNTKNPVGAGQALSQSLIGGVSSKLSLKAGASATVTFVLAWHFPNLKVEAAARDTGRSYAARFDSASAVVRHIAKNFPSLHDQTRLWRDTWYDSTLPYWFLDRTFLNTCILATSTCFQFNDGRFWAWEGVGCCEGTCTHVWHYAHAVARIFPQLERDLRERTDFGAAQDPRTGEINHRGESAGLAIDGQAGCILRAYREHQMSIDDAFLRRIWPKVKLAIQCLIHEDGNNDGILEGGQHNTLDAKWYGPVAWLSGLYLASLHAGEAMATEMGDPEFAKLCRTIADVGSKNLVERLFDGDYFINQPDPKHLNDINSGTGCEIDQVFGQSWAFQVGLGRVLPEKETVTALKSLWRYNFTPDVGPYRRANKPGRWYAMPGEAGLLMCTFPRTDWDYAKAAGKGPAWAAGYFNECMNGFEYQAAGHMIWEGMVQEGLAVTRAIHDRYAPALRNPYNEIECGDHYSRSMASYGVFLAACGFEYHGPKAHIGIAPRLTPNDFRAPFTAAEGWGTISQKAAGATQQITVTVKQGSLRIRTLGCQLADGILADNVAVRHGEKTLANEVKVDGRRAVVRLNEDVVLHAGHTVVFTIHRGE